MVCLEKPTAVDLSNNSLNVIVRYLIESIGIISVDVFVLISGWFMVKPKTKGVLSFLFQVVFLWGMGYITMLSLGKSELSIEGILRCFAFTSWDWFIKSYLMLFILAPILNTYLEYTPEKTQRKVLIWFFLFTFTYGFIGGAGRFFVSGYGPLTFIGLYLLAQYARSTSKSTGTPTYVQKVFNLNKYLDLCIVILCAIINTIIGVVSLKMNLPLFDKVYAYINPLVVVGALYFLLFFSKLKIKQNKFINWLAASSFAVYLIHSQFDIRPVFTHVIQSLYNAYNGLHIIIVIFVFLVLVYLVSVIIDQVRIIVWNVLSRKIS